MTISSVSEPAGHLPESTGRAPRFPSRLASKFLFAVCLLLVFFLLPIALRLETDSFDGFQILSNARAIGASSPIPYDISRPPLLPLLLSPLFSVEDKLGGGLFAFRAAHVAMIFVFSLLLWTLYRLFRPDLGRAAAAGGVILFSMNPLIIHAAPFTREDLLATLLTAASFHFYLRGLESRRLRDLLFAGLAIGLGMQSRYNLVPFFFFAIAACEVWRRFDSGTKPDEDSSRRTKINTLFALPVGIFLLIPALAYSLSGRTTFALAPGLFFGDVFVGVGNRLTIYHESAIEYLIFLLKSVTLPVLAFSGLGAVAARRRHLRGARIHLVWLVSFLLVHGFAISHKESRYLFPVLPSIYFFAAVGLREAWMWLAPRSRRGAIVILISVAAHPAYLAGRECRRLLDPFYRDPILREIARTASDLAGPHQVFWHGYYYALVPQEHLFDPRDETTYVHHLYSHVISYFSRKSVEAPYYGWIPAGDIFAFPRDGDVLIRNPETSFYDASGPIPDSREPILVERVRAIELLPRLQASENSSTVFTARRYPDASVSVTPDAGRIKITGEGLPDRRFILRISFQSPPGLTIGTVEVSAGKFERTLEPMRLPAGRGIKSIDLLGIDVRRAFAPFHTLQSSEATRKSIQPSAGIR